METAGIVRRDVSAAVRDRRRESDRTLYGVAKSVVSEINA
jgi:hypothetical protein